VIQNYSDQIWRSSCRRSLHFFCSTVEKFHFGELILQEGTPQNETFELLNSGAAGKKALEGGGENDVILPVA